MHGHGLDDAGTVFYWPSHAVTLITTAAMPSHVQQLSPPCTVLLFVGRVLPLEDCMHAKLLQRCGCALVVVDSWLLEYRDPYGAMLLPCTAPASICRPLQTSDPSSRGVLQLFYPLPCFSLLCKRRTCSGTVVGGTGSRGAGPCRPLQDNVPYRQVLQRIWMLWTAVSQYECTINDSSCTVGDVCSQYSFPASNGRLIPRCYMHLLVA